VLGMWVVAGEHERISEASVARQDGAGEDSGSGRVPPIDKDSIHSVRLTRKCNRIGSATMLWGPSDRHPVYRLEDGSLRWPARPTALLASEVGLFPGFGRIWSLLQSARGIPALRYQATVSSSLSQLLTQSIDYSCHISIGHARVEW
jgi:hypothetical protein